MPTQTNLDEVFRNLVNFVGENRDTGTQSITTGQREKKTRGDTLTDVLNQRNRGPIDFLNESLQGNAQFAPGLLELANFVSGNVANTTADAAKQGSKLFSGLTTDASRDAGVDIPDFTKALTNIGLRNFQAGDQQVNQADSLINGQFYNTPVGQQSLQNLQRAIAPGLSPAGLDATQNTFGGATSNNETDQVTAFLRNGIEERNTGFGLKQQGIQARDQAASRLGGVLTFGTQFGQASAQFGGQFGQGVGNLNAQLTGNQLLTPSNFLQDTQSDLNSAENFMNLKEQIKVGQDQQRSAAKAGIGSAVGQIAGAVLAPFTGGLSLALTGALAGAGAAGAGEGAAAGTS